jgi:glucose-6-phosphate dehydrogenase assembly protein OpcA
LLLPDAPVVVWWPESAPEEPAKDPVGALAQRRITDAAAAPDPHAELVRRSRTYYPGDTDLAWTRITQWRTLLAAILDQPYAEIGSGSVSCEPGSPSAELLARWLELKLHVSITVVDSAGPGITGVGLHTADGDLEVNRPDGRVAHLHRPGQPDRQVALVQRETAEIIAEEMRRLDPDEVYGEVLGTITGRPEPLPVAVGRPDEASEVSGTSTDE